MPQKKNKPFLRIIDANFNRAKEAFRVAEDLSRFILEDRLLTASFKKIRHDLTAALLRFSVPYAELLLCRESAGDVGKKSFISDKSQPSDWRDIMISNLKRAQESLRVLEECSKTFDDTSARFFQKMRFESYELERKSVQRF